jgi:5'(3')-deoxyribonucleotidase
MRIAIDFDGVICKRDGIPRTNDFRDCPPMKNALEAVRWLNDHHDIYILTNRRKDDRCYVRAWLVKHGFPLVLVTNRKMPKTSVYIDDRAIRFTNWLDISKYFV